MKACVSESVCACLFVYVCVCACVYVCVLVFRQEFQSAYGESALVESKRRNTHRLCVNLVMYIYICIYGTYVHMHAHI